jgi:hypothetical protein
MRKSSRILAALAVFVFLCCPARAEGPASEMYRKEAESFRHKAASAEGPVSETYTRLARNYQMLAELKEEAAQKDIDGEIMDWSEYHRLKGQNHRLKENLRQLKEDAESTSQSAEPASGAHADSTGEDEETPEPPPPPRFQIRTRIGQ